MAFEKFKNNIIKEVNKTGKEKITMTGKSTNKLQDACKMPNFFEDFENKIFGSQSELINFTLGLITIVMSKDLEKQWATQEE